MIEQPTTLISTPKSSVEELGEHIYKEFCKARNVRLMAERDWDSIYRLYRGSKSDMDAAYQDSFGVGSKKTWHHRINTGKTFATVQTLIAYFKGATFPSDDWFDAAGMAPDLLQASVVVKEFAKQKLKEAHIVDVFDDWLLYLVIYGVSTFKVGWSTCTERVFTRTFDEMGLPVDVAKNKDVSRLEVEAVSPLDTWLDPTSPLNEGGIWRRLRPSKQDLFYWADTGYITLDEKSIEGYDDTVHGDPLYVKDTVNKGGTDVIEYYGKPLYKGTQYWCVHAIFFGNRLVRLADSEYWCGSPYVSTTMFRNRDSIYGMSILSPSHGALHILNVLSNSRLDNLAVSIDKMWTLVEDGILNQEDVYTEPGKVFKVAQHGSLQPVDMGPNNYVVTYQEAQFQEAGINEVTSTGPLVGGGQPRGGERVTAAEIVAVQDSGGNRLASVHIHIEEAGTKPLLSKVFTTLQQYVITPETVKVFMPDIDMNAFFSLDPTYLSYPFTFTPTGANYVVEKQRALNDLMQLFDVAGRVPPLAEMLNFRKILTELLKQMRFRNPASYLNPDKPAPLAPEAEAPNLEESLGGEQMQLGVNQQIQQDGGAAMLDGLGVDTSGVPPELLQQMTGPLLQQGQGQNDPNSQPIQLPIPPGTPV
jgi:hypothetical protein